MTPFLTPTNVICIGIDMDKMDKMDKKHENTINKYLISRFAF